MPEKEKVSNFNIFKRVSIAIAICALILEIILQAAGFVVSLKVKKQILTAAGDYNIFCIGDSFTYGLGVAPENSYPKQLENILNTAQSRKHINVINLGVPGYNSSQALDRLKENFNLYKPRIVLVMTGMNNCWNFIGSSYSKVAELKVDSPFKFRLLHLDSLLSKLKTYKLVKILFLNLINRFHVCKETGDSLVKANPYLTSRKVLPPRPEELLLLLKKGLQYYEEGRYDLSEEAYRKALELSPADWEPHWYMGRFYNFRSQYEKAREELIYAVENAPDVNATIGILADFQDQKAPRDSKAFKDFMQLFHRLRRHWIERFGEEQVRYFIDPVISYKEDVFESVLFYDLNEMRNYLKQNSSSMVLLTYPYLANKLRYPKDIFHRVTNYLDIPLVDNASLFAKYLKAYKYEDLFVRDGHCSELGYKFIAENIISILKKYNLIPF